MRAFISVDLEGMPFVVSLEHLVEKGALYNEARKIATEITLTAADALHRAGFDEVVIADSHGPMVNLLPEELPEYVYLVRGYPRPMAMVAGAEGCDVALFLGYHAKAGTPYAIFDHTYSGANVGKLELNGIEVSEFLLNGFAVGHFNIPVILVGGDKKLLEDDVEKFTPWAERVAFKEAFSRYSAISPSMKKIKKELENAVFRAVEKYKNGETKPLKLDYPVRVKLTFNNSGMADAGELLPGARRIDGKTVEFEARDIIEAYKAFQLLVFAAGGVTSLLRR
ncbi:MAG: D-amino peptidase [Thermococcaceae archaeon]|jgi:D-amino peptidase|uniref:M55 family metallopeptidase n=1 Tax=Thermococcus sp. PK TaxID=913025 RepID=UPI0005B2E759|nr:M55 family metallopeptidase [Thermococcus sp. PK]MDK2853298.1 D-amino peptidase [Thermococcaceae archaeon]MDN5321209.1 D-amino peptidase [Thermococcaceae archaeon]